MPRTNTRSRPRRSTSASAPESPAQPRASVSSEERRTAGSAPFPCVMVIFGASGDLTGRMLMPALFNLERDGLLSDRFAVVGYARTEMDDHAFRSHIMDALAAHFGGRVPGTAWKRFSKRLHYVSGAYDDEDGLRALARRLDEVRCDCGAERVLYYMAVPPAVAEAILRTLDRARLVPRDRTGAAAVMMEKPFGLDLESARRLDKVLSSLFRETDIYRVDHYLGKDTIRNLLLLRFANSIFEPLWDRRYVDNMQITAAESLGLEGRGGYYDEAGVVRDVLQNHALQVLSLIAMDPPIAGDAESVRDKKLEVIKAVGPIGEGDYVFGQYRGYRREKGVARGSMTPTFAAVRLSVNNWRWFGVPFYVRAGKCLARKFTEVTIVFKQIPLCVLDDQSLCAAIRPNVIFVRIQPDEGIRLSFQRQGSRPSRRDNHRRHGVFVRVARP